MNLTTAIPSFAILLGLGVGPGHGMGDLPGVAARRTTASAVDAGSRTVGLPQRQGPVPGSVPGRTPFLAVLADGRVIPAAGFSVEATGGSGGARITLEQSAGGGGGRDSDQRNPVSVPWPQLVGLHGPPPDATATPHSVQLLDGSVLRGRVVGGDDYGDSLALESPALGMLQVPVEAVGSVGFTAAARTWASDPDGDDVLYVEARLGVDSIVGALHRLDGTGVWFARGDREEPDHYAYGNILGLGVANEPLESKGEQGSQGDGGQGPAAVLLTRYADRVQLQGLRSTAEGLRLKTVLDRELLMVPAQLSALTPFGADRTHLSDSLPAAVAERSVEDPDYPLYPHRMDRSVLGGPLLAGGHCAAKGIGVHAESQLTWRVPKDRSRFLTWVAIDDAALELLPRAHVEMQVLLDGKPVAGPTPLVAGEPAVKLGPVPVSRGQELTLRIGFGKGLDLADRVVWLHPVLLR